MAEIRTRLIWAIIVIFPLAMLTLLLRGLLPDPIWRGPVFHFYVVTVTSLIALAPAVLMRIAAGQLRDPRALMMSLAFLGIAGIFLIHALTTPGVLVKSGNPWVGFSARLSLLVGASCFVLGTVTWRPRIHQRIVRYQAAITAIFLVGLLGYGTVALTTSFRADSLAARAASLAGQAGIERTIAAPTNEYDDDYASEEEHEHDYGYGGDAGHLPGYETDSTTAFEPFNRFFLRLADPSVLKLFGVLTVLLFGYVILRFVTIYRSQPLPLAAGFLASAILLCQSQLSMTIAPNWHASWWEYHILMLAGFAAAIIGLAREYARNGSLQGVVGGLLLRDTVTQLQQGYTEVIVALVEAVEAKDPYTRGHTQRVSELSLLIGKQIGMGSDRLRTLHQAAMLHDIGKIGIPDSILNKPGPLTSEEFAVIQEHPLRGYRIIQNVRSLKNELCGVRYHHERLDGSGYPDGLTGEAIPLEARIIAVADVFDALTSARPYREAWPVERALEIIDAETGIKLDPACVAALKRVLPIWAGHAASISLDLEPAPRKANPRDPLLRPIRTGLIGASKSD